MYLLLEFFIFCKNLVCKSAILKTLYARALAKQKASAKEWQCNKTLPYEIMKSHTNGKIMRWSLDTEKPARTNNRHPSNL